MIELVRFYRGWMKEYRKGGMPIWITECGKAWSRGIVPKRTYGPPYGRERAPVNEDKLSALWIVMKGVEAKAAGIEKAITFEFSHFMSPNSCYRAAGHLFNRYCEHFNLAGR